MYKVSVEYKPTYKDGRKIIKPSWVKEESIFLRKNNKGILRGAKSFENHLVGVYGKSNVRRFTIKKI